MAGRGLVKLDVNDWERHDYITHTWEKLCGSQIGFQYSTSNSRNPRHFDGIEGRGTSSHTLKYTTNYLKHL